MTLMRTRSRIAINRALTAWRHLGFAMALGTEGSVSAWLVAAVGLWQRVGAMVMRATSGHGVTRASSREGERRSVLQWPSPMYPDFTFRSRAGGTD